MIQKIKDWLEGQGFSLEMRAASAFRAAGFEVRQSSYYSDSETGKGREIDVVARDPDTLGVVDITFIVECKSTKKPWVILCSPDVLAGYNRLFAFGVLSEKAIRLMAENMTDLVTRIDWLQKDGLVGYSARQALSDSDTAYAAAIAVAKACDFWVHTPESNYSPPYSVAFPVIVVDSPIFQCTLGMDGSIEIAEVEQGEFLFAAKLPRNFGSCIRLVSVNHLSVFVSEAKTVAGLLRSEFKPAEQRVVDSWYVQKSE